MTTTSELPYNIGRWYATKISKIAGSVKLQSQYLEIKKCSESIRDELRNFFVERLDQEILNSSLDAGWCIDDPNATIGGTYLDPNLEWILIGV